MIEAQEFELTIVIPTKNGAESLPDLLEALASQVTSVTYDVLAIDSGSTDGSVEILSNHGVALHEIPPQEFSHSRTRNLGADLASATRYLVFNNQDAVPTNESWLEGLVRTLESDQAIKAACAVEIDRTRDSPFNIEGPAASVFKQSLVDGTYVFGPEILELAKDLKKIQLRKLYAFTTVSAIFDKPHFEQHPFDPKVEYGEDLHWAVAAVARGDKIACTTRAQVYHTTYHSERERRQRAKLNLDIGTDLFGRDYASNLYRVALALRIPTFARVLNSWVRRIVSDRQG